ncbi:polysaccharide pyruvyl transferase family protein [Pseudogracilibacillus sp. SE30717A]|uniref:polysaccharide pyruvyl transferase family protein n=1 Tax=Pseudogracilibacillus sp. SE30717A TaxID=3098293 RepID=UPI00300DDC22
MLYAYTANNLGDDLFIHILCTRYPNTKFICYAPKTYQQTFSYLHNLHIVPNDRFLNKLVHTTLKPYQKEYVIREQIARDCEIGIYIGGSLFMEQDNWKAEARNFDSMKHCHSSFFVLGANFGPYHSQEFLNTYKTLFQGITDICFRDNYSKALFSDFQNIRQAADIVFQFSNATYKVEEKNQLVISVIYPSVRNNLKSFDNLYFHAIATIIIQSIKEGYNVILMGFCKEEKDDLAIDTILSIIPKQWHHQIQTYQYTTHLPSAIELISESSAIIATRFHAMILGLVFHKPVFPIIYSEKMKTVLEDIEFPNLYSTVQNIDCVSPSQVTETFHQEPIDIHNFIQSADKQFDMLDQFLN